MNDEQLFARFLNGDASAFNELYQRYRGRLENYLRHRGARQMDAEDLVQETFWACSRAATFNPAIGPFEAWLFTIARNRWIDFCRKRGLLFFVGAVEYAKPMKEGVPDQGLKSLEEAEERCKQARRLWECVGRLPHRQRLVMELTLRAKSPGEIAQELGISEHTVRTQQHYAKPRLRQCMEGH